MDRDGTNNQVFPLTYGRDRVYRRNEKLIVYSMAENPYWEVREYRKTAIIIEDEVWCVSGKENMGKRSVRYTLDPWPDHAHQNPGRRLCYNAEYVRSRDSAIISEGRRNLGSLILAYFEFLVGFLPSGIKISLEEKFGISSRNATMASLILELVVFFCIGAITVALSFANLYTHASFMPFVQLNSISIFAALILFADLVMRYDSYLRESRSPLGFYEWAARPLIRLCKHPRSASIHKDRPTRQN